ncbi:hypothetical protein F5887DRAFT_1150370 [Amanita rubescens]|nr:hypothetical protein F5887DRAFT_1150370 [Amanita rubescens]
MFFLHLQCSWHSCCICSLAPLPQLPLMRRTSSEPPVISPNISLRKRTVEGLYDAMMEERLIYVRGTPGSGKSTLLNLLHQHILQKDPKAFVCVTWSWPPGNLGLSAEQKSDSYFCLKAIIPDFPRRTSPAFLLMDEAQESFGDGYLWNGFLKNIIDNPSCYRVVVFCSYGSVSTPVKSIDGGTPTDLDKAACMTLWPSKVNKGTEIHGLLLDWDEFSEVVLQFNEELAIDLDLSQEIFEMTAGHVGAVIGLLRLILNDMKTHIRRKGPLTLDTYYENFSLDHIMNRLAGAFTRGLPDDKDLSDHPDVSRLLRRLLVSGRVTEGTDNAAIRYCHRKGWIYAEDAPGPQSYTFATPLHHAALSWRLQPTDGLPQFETPYALSLAVLKQFKPSQMKLAIRRVDGGSTDLPPEAQYQDEYYRSLIAVTCGNVRISPEFASARKAKVAGRIDFFIPNVKWGIEITRDGDRLNDHASRFKADGAYGKWLKDGDMTDYVLLDCRTNPPKTSHSELDKNHIPNLYHVVFNKQYTEVRVFNNKVDQVWGPIALQENHK